MKLDPYEAENLEYCVEVLEKTAPRPELAAAYRAALNRAGTVAHLDKVIQALKAEYPTLSYWHARRMLLTKSEATHFAGCTLPALNDAIRTGKIKCYNVDGGPHILMFDALELAHNTGEPERPESTQPVQLETSVIRIVEPDGTTTLQTIEHAPIGRQRKR